MQKLFFSVFSIVLTANIALANPGMNPSPEVTQAGGITTFWSLTKLGGGISVAIFGVLAIGLFLIVFQIYELIMDKIRGKALLATNYRQLSVNDVSKLVMNQPNSLIARLYSVLLSIFHTTGNTQDFHDEIANYIQLQQDRFNTFRSRLSFLSDTAGALGLLGTVWGMFVTFFGGNLDSQRILNGMGLALVTTLVGLVVSIILNFCATEVFSVFNKRIELISSKSDEFRLWLMAIVKQRHRKATEDPAGGSGGSSRGVQDHNDNQATSRPKAPAFSLKAVTDNKQDGIIGHTLPNPVTVLVESEDGQRLSGVPLHFQIMEGGGKFDNRQSVTIVKTDSRGAARLNWTLGETVGAQKMQVSAPNLEGQALEFVAFAQPFIPNLKTFDSVMPEAGIRKKMTS